MVTRKELNYIRYCLANRLNLEEAEEKLLSFIKIEEEARLYSILASFKDTNEEKRLCYEKALEIDPEYASAYRGLFLCDICDENYESARENLLIYEPLFIQNNGICNMVLYRLLIDELLEIEDEVYEVDDFFGTTRLKDDVLKGYHKIFKYIYDENYEAAYSLAQYINDKEKDIDMEYVIFLISKVIKKRTKEEVEKKKSVEFNKIS